MTVEPQTGFEPAFHAWKARALPLELLRHICILSPALKVPLRYASAPAHTSGYAASLVPSCHRSIGLNPSGFHGWERPSSLCVDLPVIIRHCPSDVSSGLPIARKHMG